MKSEELQQEIIELLKTKKEITPQEIQYNLKDNPVLIQIYSALKKLVSEEVVLLCEEDKHKYYSLKQVLKSKVQYNNNKPVKVKVNTKRDYSKYQIESDDTVYSKS